LSLIQSSDIAWQVSRCSTRRNFMCKKSQGKGDNSFFHIYSYQTLLDKSLDAVQKEIVYVKGHKEREIIQFVTDTYQSSDITWQVSRCSTRINCICKNSQGKGDNSVCHLCSYQTLLGKFLDIVQEEMLYVKSQKGREIIHFVTYTVIRHCLSSL
jgi:RNA polymerase-interacting CarD/CdnL/TRCF family regulator